MSNSLSLCPSGVIAIAVSLVFQRMRSAHPPSAASTEGKNDDVDRTRGMEEVEEHLLPLKWGMQKARTPVVPLLPPKSPALPHEENVEHIGMIPGLEAAIQAESRKANYNAKERKKLRKLQQREHAAQGVLQDLMQAKNAQRSQVPNGMNGDFGGNASK